MIWVWVNLEKKINIFFFVMIQIFVWTRNLLNSIKINLIYAKQWHSRLGTTWKYYDLQTNLPCVYAHIQTQTHTNKNLICHPISIISSILILFTVWHTRGFWYDLYKSFFLSFIFPFQKLFWYFFFWLSLSCHSCITFREVGHSVLS